MPRTKQAAKRGNHQPSSRGGRRGPNNHQGSYEPFDGLSKRGNTGFTLLEEARNTERHHDFWNTDKKLRHSKVNFISAGHLEPSDPKDAESAMAKMTLDSPEPEKNEAIVKLDEDYEDGPTMDGPTSSGKYHEEENAATFVIDTIGNSPVHTGLPPPHIRASSPTLSNSSEEIILFRGRDQEGRAVPGRSLGHKAPAPAELIDRKIRVVEDRIHELEEVLHQSDASRQANFSYASSSERKPQLSREQNSHKVRKSKYTNIEKTEEDAIIADYLANIADEDIASLRVFGQRELGGDLEADSWQEAGESSNDVQINEVLNSGWGRSDLCDFDDFSTSDGVLGEVHAILSKRDRASGVQYLVVWENQTVDEARWVPSTTLTSEVALELITQFEKEEKLVPQYADNDEEDTDDSTDINLVGDDIIEVEEEGGDTDDDIDLRGQRTSRMSDEQIARLLAKQEELGMGSAELLLFDNEADDDEEEEYFPRSTFVLPMIRSKGKGKGKETGSKRPKGEFPSASKLADAYDGFDVMDFERPSLKKKPKGRRGKLEFDLSDSELEAVMQMSFENDRLRKKDKKLEREELRAQGLLGGKKGKVDMNNKYKEGMGIHAVKEEIKTFLMGDNSTLALPPMDKADRKVVHELANAFNLKSKSAGSGNKRFPILTRTLRTSTFTENAFNAVEARLSRKYLPRMDVKRSGAAIKRAGVGGGFNKAAVSYRDGDVVGGSAPELGADNRGRAMLEKMGWSSGTALGALNNKGILQPVSHVVKTTKAGLG